MILILVISISLLTIYLSMQGLFKPGIMLALMWSMYAIEQVIQQGSSVIPIRSSFINIYLTLFTSAAVFRAFMTDRYKGFKISYAHIWMLLLVSLCALSYFWSISPRDTEEHLLKHMPYVLAFSIVAPFCAFDKKQLNIAIKVIIYFGGILLLALAVSSLGRRGIVVDRIAGEDVEANPLAAASFGAYVTICSLFFLYSRRSRNTLFSFIHIAIAMLGIYTIIRSGSRGQLISVLIACFIWLPITARMAAKRSIIMAYIGAILFAGGSIFLIDYTGFSGRWKEDFLMQATEGRLHQLLIVLEKMWKAGPSAWLFGLGSSSSFKVIGWYPHNVPGEVLAEEGLLGFSFYMAFMIAVTKRGLDFMRLKNTDFELRVIIGLLLTLFTFEFGLGLKQGSFLSSSGIYCIGLCIITCTQLMKKKSRHPLAGQLRRVQSIRPARR